MIWREFKFLLVLWKTNLIAVMEYRAAFLSQMIGMMLNNVVYFMYWVIFFDRFENVRGWELSEMFMLFGVVAASIGLSMFLFGNITMLSDVIAGGRLDYYLSLPRPVLLHVIAGRTVGSGFGDFIYGWLSFFLAGNLSFERLGRFLFAITIATTVFVSFMILVHSLTFWLGNASMLGRQALNAIITFSIYPITLFDGTAKLVLFTVLPAAFIGAIPMEFIRAFTWNTLFLLLAVALLILVVSLMVFHRGLRRYESGSAIQVQL